MAKLLAAGAKLLASGAKLLVSRAKLLVSGANLLVSGAKLLVAGANFPPTGDFQFFGIVFDSSSNRTRPHGYFGSLKRSQLSRVSNPRRALCLQVIHIEFQRTVSITHVEETEETPV